MAALELAHRRVRVNAVAPGLVVTPLTVLSDDAAWVTGETLDINGGAHLMRYPDLVGLIEKAFA